MNANFRELFGYISVHSQIYLSLPDQVFYEAEEATHYMDIPRSKLYVNAMLEYLEKNNRKKITEKLNEIYNDDYYKEFEPIEYAGLESIREITKNERFQAACSCCAG